MGPVIFPYIIYSGDPIPVSLTFYQPDGVTIKDLTGIVVGCTLKVNITDADTAALYKKDTSGTSSGKVTFELPGQPAGEYWFDVKTWDNTNIRQPVLQTQIPVQQSVTQRTTPTPTP